MNRLKKIARYLLGLNEDYTLEERFYIASLLIGILMGIIGFVSNYLMLDSIVSIMLPLAMTVVIGVFYYFVRFKGIFRLLTFPIVISAYIGIFFIWLFNGGMDGSNELVFIVAFVLGLNMVEGRKKIYVLGIFVLLKTILYFIQLHYPDFVTPYPSQLARWLDIYITSITSSVIIFLTIKYLHNNYRLERVKADNTRLELEKLNAQLVESTKTKDLFFSIISHDLKSPFNSILGFSNLILKNIDKYDKEKIYQLTSNVNLVANETLLLLQNLLEWSRLQQGILVANCTRLSLQKLINDLGSFYYESAQKKGIELKNNVTNDFEVFCDEEMTKTIFRNLLTNAIKYTNENGFIQISATTKDSMVEIKIEDNGIGIDKEKINQLFSDDLVVSASGTQNEKGTGLGLHLCKALAAKQNGDIWAESDLGVGSSFYFTIKKSDGSN